MIKKNLLLVAVSLLLGILKLLSIDGIYHLDQYLVAVFQFINEWGLISIYANILYVLPFLIIVLFTVNEIREYYDNRILIISRFGSKKKYYYFLLGLIVKKVFCNTLILFCSVLLFGIALFSSKDFNFSFIIIMFINLLGIGFVFSFLFCLFLSIFDYQHAYLAEVISLLVCPISGFVLRHMENFEAFELNFMTRNTVFDLKVPLAIEINDSAFYVTIIILMVLLVLIKIKGEGK